MASNKYIGEIEIERKYCKTNDIGPNKQYIVQGGKGGWAIIFPSSSKSSCSMIYNRINKSPEDNFQSALERLYEEDNLSAADYVQVFDTN